MKITIVLGAFFPVPTVLGGAVEKAWWELAREFAARGHEVALISRRYASFPPEEILENVRLIRVRGFDSPSSLFWLKFLDLIYSLRVRRKLPDADIVVTNTFWLPALKVSARRGRIYVHVARFPKGQVRFYRRAARLQAPSEAVAAVMKMQAPALAERVTVIPYPAPRQSADSVVPISQRPRIVLYLGRVHPEKGVHLLVGCFAERARTLFAGWQLMIVGPTSVESGGGGDAYLAKLNALAAPAGDAIDLAGPSFAPGSVTAAMSKARIFVYPSLAERGETFGLAVLEAMSSGCAVVVSNLGCFRDFVTDGETGYVFNHRAPDPVQALGSRLEDVLRDETKLAEVGRRGYEKAREYSGPRIAERFLQDFQTILE